MANSDRGTKRTDPDTGKKFYDLNLDPIVSPFTGKSYPRSYFENVVVPAKAQERAAAKFVEAEETEEEEEVVAADEPEIVSLDEADAEESADEEIPDVDDVEVEDELGEDEADVFLEEEDDDDDDIGFGGTGDEDR